MNCPRCGGRGILGGNLDGPYCGAWRWCSCAEALERQASEPGIVDEANAARDRLLSLNKPGLSDRVWNAAKRKPAELEPYRGTF